MYMSQWRYRSTHSYPRHYMRGECTGSCYSCFNLLGRSPLNQLNRKPGGPQWWPWHFGEDTNLLPQANQPQDYSLFELEVFHPKGFVKENGGEGSSNTTVVILTFSNRASYIYIGRAHRYPPNTPFYIFFQQIYVLNVLNMLHTLRFFLFKMPFIS